MLSFKDRFALFEVPEVKSVPDILQSILQNILRQFVNNARPPGAAVHQQYYQYVATTSSFFKLFQFPSLRSFSTDITSYSLTETH